MKTSTLRAVVVGVAVAVFGALSISPGRAQTSTTNTTSTPSGGCCGSTGTSSSH